MREMGMSRVRIGEFAWSRIEPRPGEFDWEWLDAAVETLGHAGLGVILCTPTATPPRWLVEVHPDILPVDREGRVRGFGSRRHYDFSSPAYREHSARITRAVAERYGRSPNVVGWQTDNEYGCHDSVRSYSPAARAAFAVWLKAKYEDVRALNAAWGNVFWSMELGSFDDVGLPNLTVTEANPAHWLDFCRFSSDQVVAFDAEQVAILRELSPGRMICHNVMGISLDFDHFDLGANHDMLAWDSYPLGFLEQSAASEDHKTRYHRTGDPDFQSFHHDLYRNCAPRWGVMEQQTGPVNWAPHNPFPREGQVRLWGEEALAHGADLVSWFRWRQCPFAQEQNHSGLLEVDGQIAPGGREAREVAPRDLGEPVHEAALIFDYQAAWLFDIQPQGQGWSYWELVQRFYRALRVAGLNVDVVGPDADLSDFALVVAPSLPILDDAVTGRLRAFEGVTLFGPRTGSKTPHHRVPDTQPPGRLAGIVPMRIGRWESLRPGATLPLRWQGQNYTVGTWREDIAPGPGANVLAEAGGVPALLARGRAHYLGVWPSEALARDLVAHLAREAGLDPRALPGGVRMRKTARGRFLCNYGPDPAEVEDLRLAPSATHWDASSRP